MIRFKIFPILIFVTTSIEIIMAQSKLSGVYELRGIHEMASAFEFKKDKTFEFYYVYGAVDRMAKGTYEVVGDTVKLKSQKTPGQDFEVKMQKKQGKGYHFSFTAPNVYLLRRIICITFNGSDQHEYETDQEGIVDIPENKVDKIYVQHLLFPDILSLIKDETNDSNYFELALKKSLTEVSFKGIDLIKKGDELHMLPNYFMPFEKIVYRKE